MPEEKLNSEKQLEILRDKLMGNQAFAVCRGKLGTPITGITSNLITETNSPTNFLDEWDEFFGKARVMTNLLAQFHREGMGVAYGELFAALQSKDHFFPGETVPIEKTRPVTLLMLEPTKTIVFLRWLLEEHWVTLRDYLYWKDVEKISSSYGQKVEQPSLLTKQLYEEFPTLEMLARKHLDEYEGAELSSAYRETITNTFSREILKNGDRAELVYSQWNDHVENVGRIPFLYMFDMEQSKVLKLFSREDQKRVATWQFHLPKVIALPIYIGLHPEEFHDDLEKVHPAFVSRGKSQGLGALTLLDNPVSGHNSGEDSTYPTRWHSGGPEKYAMIFRVDSRR